MEVYLHSYKYLHGLQRAWSSTQDFLSNRGLHIDGDVTYYKYFKTLLSRSSYSGRDMVDFRRKRAIRSNELSCK